MPEKELYRNQISRLVSSQVLHSSESLCKLLQYLAKHALEHPNTPLKEYQLATEVFGRRSDFDPQSDSTIRVQAGRLRLKLAEYYSSEGAHDPVIVELPKGTYILSFHQREQATSKPAFEAAAAPNMPGKVDIAWEDFDDERAMGAVWPRFLPLLNEDAAVEAEIPWRKWLKTAQGRRSTSPEWLIERFNALPLSPAEKARLYESLHMPLRWRLENSRVSRTRNSRPVPKIFFHTEPLLTRKDVALDAELRRKPPRLVRLPPKQGRVVTDLIREVMLVRYRELYGTTLADPNSVVRADVGRGVTIYLWGLPPDRRLPLRAYVAGVTLKNGVPVNYIEAIGLFEWMEIGFNTFYTYRGGEVAWIFAQVLRCLTAHMSSQL